MKHPLFSLGDGTEVTASSMKDGQVHVYTERWSDEKDMFLHADIVIPGASVVSSEGYSDEEIRKMFAPGNVIVLESPKLSIQFPPNGMIQLEDGSMIIYDGEAYSDWGYVKGHPLKVTGDWRHVELPLLDTLSTRKTTRVYSSRMLDAQMLSNLLWAAFGINREDGRRTAPSALNSQEIQIYVILEGGIYVYEPKEHALERKLAGDYRKLAGTQSYAQSVPVSFVYVADLEKSLTSPESSESYACVDCGFIGQNVYLFAAANGLCSAFRGSIDRKTIAETLKNPENPWYGVDFEETIPSLVRMLEEIRR